MESQNFVPKKGFDPPQVHDEKAGNRVLFAGLKIQSWISIGSRCRMLVAVSLGAESRFLELGNNHLM